MKNTDKSVLVITTGGDCGGVYTNMKAMFEALESKNNAGTCDTETVWEEFPTYNQCLEMKRKQGEEGYLFHLYLSPIVNFACSVTISEIYLNRK